MYKNHQNGGFSPSHFCQNLAKDPVLNYKDLGPILDQLLKFIKKFNFDWNQLKLSTQHKYMYMYQKM